MKKQKAACSILLYNQRKGSGTGLGLSTVYGILGSHDGLIDVESEIGKGTTINVFFRDQFQRNLMLLLKVLLQRFTVEKRLS